MAGGALFLKADRRLVCWPCGSDEAVCQVPPGTAAIGDIAFYNCHNLTTVLLPEGLTAIGDGAFYGCSALTSVNLPRSLRDIDSDAFHECRSLTLTVLPGSPAEEYCRDNALPYVCSGADSGS